ncbi:unnamed protein product [Allacma fusca]|uniref:Uncharacterized protein n=1 Tax=Allacma fusca TaxID=39272 RepID=A0A8J2JXH7_9HEXA|nr:unnamed protein product [Allacma fusca]
MGCFNPKFWSKLIGYVELIINAGSTIFFAHYLLKFVQGGEEAVIEESKEIEAVEQYYYLGYGFIISVLATLVVISVLGFVMAIVLLRGAYKREYQKLNVWMIYCIIAAGITFLILITCGGYIWTLVTRSFLFLVVRGAMIWSVYVDMKELEGELKTDDKAAFAKKTADTAI